MADTILHCWHGENDDNEISSDGWIEIFVRGEGTCLLPDGHDGPHIYTPDDEFTIVFATEPAARQPPGAAGVAGGQVGEKEEANEP